MSTKDLPLIVWVPVVALAVLVLAFFVLVGLMSSSHHHDRIPINEDSAEATLKSAIYPAELQFQDRAILDQDHNGVGEFGLLSELSGRRGAGSHAPGAIRYLVGPFAKGDVSCSYHFALYLPDDKGGSVSEPKAEGLRGVASKDAIAQQEKHFIAYAWPEDATAGRYMFAITEAGKIRFAPWTGRVPSWNTALGAQGWGADPVWQQYGK